MRWTGSFRDVNCSFGSTRIVADIPILKQAQAEYAKLRQALLALAFSSSTCDYLRLCPPPPYKEE